MQNEPEKNTSYNTFIGSIPGFCTKDDIYKLLSKYSKVKNLELATKKNKNGDSYCLGFGFALLEDDPEDIGVIDPNPAIKIFDRVLKIKKNLKGQEREKFRHEMAAKRLFIQNICSSSSNDDLKDIFAIFGAVDSTSIIRKKVIGKDTHYGYVVFEDKESAKKALQYQESLILNGLKLEIKPFRSKVLESKKNTKEKKNKKNKGKKKKNNKNSKNFNKNSKNHVVIKKNPGF